MTQSVAFDVACSVFAFLMSIPLAYSTRTLDQLTDNELKGQTIPITYTGEDQYTQAGNGEIINVIRGNDKNKLVLELTARTIPKRVMRVDVVSKSGTLEVPSNGIHPQTTREFSFRSADLVELVQKIAGKNAPLAVEGTKTTKS